MDSRQLLPATASTRLPAFVGATIPDSMPPSSSAKRSNVSSACEECRQRKQRCDGRRPCRPCVSAQKECNYFRKDRRRHVDRDDSIQADMERLQASMNVLKFGSDRQALEALGHLRHGLPDSKRFPHWERKSPVSVDGASSESSHPETHFRETTVSSDGQSPPMYTNTNVPSRAVIEQGAEYFFNVMTKLVYIIDQSEFQELCIAVYETGPPPTTVDIAEICAVAALGSYCDPHGLPEGVEDTLLRTAVQCLNDAIDKDSLRAMRCLACLALYGAMQKKKSTRTTIHLGLQTSRWTMNERHRSIEDFTVWKKLTRTLVFLECLSSATLGHDPDITPNEIDIVQRFPISSTSPQCEVIRVKISELGLLRAKVLKCVSLAYLAPAQATIEQLTVEMASWYRSLPPNMALMTLISGETNPDSIVQRGAPLLAHAMYLGTFILLHRRVLAATAGTMLGREWQLYDVTKSEAHRFHNECVDAARSTMRIFVLLDFGVEVSAIHTRCWLSAFEIYTACTVLLYDTAVKIATEPHRDPVVNENLNRTRICLDLLKGSDDGHSASVDLHATLSSLHRQLEELCTSSAPATSNVRSPASTTSNPGSDIDAGSSSAFEGHSNLWVRNVAMRVVEAVAKILEDTFSQDTGNDGSSSSGLTDTRMQDSTNVKHAQAG